MKKTRILLSKILLITLVFTSFPMNSYAEEKSPYGDGIYEEKDGVINEELNDAPEDENVIDYSEDNGGETDADGTDNGTEDETLDIGEETAEEELAEEELTDVDIAEEELTEEIPEMEELVEEEAKAIDGLGEDADPEEEYEEIVSGITFKYTINEDGACITEATAADDTPLVIPGLLGGKNVVEIGDSAFYGRTFTGSVTIPDTVTRIGDWAFMECKNLNGNITIGSNVETIGNRAFYHCENLKGNLTIPASVVSVDEYAFYYCKKLNGKLTLNSGLETVGERAFSGCGLTSMTAIPDTVTSIGKYAFAYSKFSGNINLPSGLTELGAGAFNNCENLSGTPVIPAGITKIPEFAFAGTGITGITIPETVTAIGESAFSLCPNLSGDIVIPGSVKVIEQSAFLRTGDNGNIRNINISEGVEEVSYMAFEKCMAKGTLTLPSTLKIIGNEAFSDCSNLTGTLSLPDGLTIIGSNSFYKCSRLTGGLRIPGTVKTVGPSAFCDCSGLNGTLTIENGVEVLGSETENLYLGSVFRGCSKLTGDLIIPDTVKKIGYYSFMDCSGFNGYLKLPDNSDFETVYEYTFQNCTSITGNLVIPSNVKNIKLNAFKNCGFDGTLVLSEDLEKIEAYAFDSCTRFRGDIDLSNSPNLSTIGQYAFANCSSADGAIRFNDRITTVLDRTFYDCSSIEAIAFADGLQTIGSQAFAGCSSVRNADLPNTVKNVEACAFAMCSELETVKLSSALEKLADNEKTHIYSIGYPYIDDCQSAFYKCNKLTKITNCSGNGFARKKWTTNPADTTSWINLDGDVVEMLESGATIYKNRPEEIIKSILVSDDSTNPTISIVVSDINAVGTISVVLDETEIISSDNYLSKYDEFNDEIIYEVETPLSDGNHTVTATAYAKDGRLSAPPMIKEFAVRINGDVDTEDIPEDGIPNGLWIAGLNEAGYTYTGNAIKPKLRVYSGKTLLKEKTDYTLTYARNINVNDGSVLKTAPIITIKAKGNYSGTKTVPFAITRKNIADPDMSFAAIATVLQSKNIYKPSPKVMYGKKTLTTKNDYYVKYYSDPECTVEVAPKTAGTYYIKFFAREKNYTGTAVKSFVIENADKILLNKCTFKVSNQVYDGTAKAPTVTVIYNKKRKLVLDEEYTVSYSGDHTNIGTAKIIITGNGTSVIGTKTITYKITGKSITNTNIYGLVSSFKYDGTEKLQNSVVLKDKKTKAVLNGILKTDYDALGAEEQKEYDYVYSYSANTTNAGKCSITFAGVNYYSGKVVKKYTIKAYDITPSKDAGNNFTVTVAPGSESVDYRMAGAVITPIVQFKGVTLTKGVDYTVSFEKNKAAYTGTSSSKMPTVIIKGKGNFAGVDKTCKFNINKKSMNDGGFTVTVSDRAYSTKKGAWKSAVTVYDPEGKKLKANKDYYNIVYTYEDGTTKIGANDKPAIGSVIKVTVTGKGNYSGTCTGQYVICKYDISAIQINIRNKQYTGSPILLSTDDISFGTAKKPVNGVTYKIDKTSYVGNNKVGKASVVIVGTGDYRGSKRVTFKITAKPFSFVSAFKSFTDNMSDN